MKEQIVCVERWKVLFWICHVFTHGTHRRRCLVCSCVYRSESLQRNQNLKNNVGVVGFQAVVEATEVEDV